MGNDLRTDRQGDAAAPRVLVVDDERAIADLVVELLAREGMDARACYSGDAALDAFAKETFDIVILDIMMPGIDGFEVCSRLRAASDVPIIFLSAKDEETDKVVGLMLGGDDYVVKPFKHRELVARIRARLRRLHSAAAPDRANRMVEANGIAVDLDAYAASLHGEPLALTPKEFGVLALLVRRAGSPVSAREIYESVWGEPFLSSSANSVMVHIRHLRAKLATIDSSEELIETAWGVGYRVPRRGTDAAAGGSDGTKGRNDEADAR